MTHVCSWFFGFIGFLALWAGKFDPEVDPTYSTVMFSIFNGNTGVLVIIALLGTSMSTGAIDSYQNAIVDTISGVYLRNSNVLYSRALVVLLNVPCIVCSLQVHSLHHDMARSGSGVTVMRAPDMTLACSACSLQILRSLCSCRLVLDGARF